jgi:hypothetical protein
MRSAWSYLTTGRFLPFPFPCTGRTVRPTSAWYSARRSSTWASRNNSGTSATCRCSSFFYKPFSYPLRLCGVCTTSTVAVLAADDVRRGVGEARSSALAFTGVDGVVILSKAAASFSPSCAGTGEILRLSFPFLRVKNRGAFGDGTRRRWTAKTRPVTRHAPRENANGPDA